jgi:hypothetical protein
MSKCNTCGVLKKICCDNCNSSKGIPLADRKPDQVNSGRMLHKALKKEKLLGGGKAI